MVIGTGSTDKILKQGDISAYCQRAFEDRATAGKRLLFIIPDYTRTAPVDIFFKVIYKLLAGRVAALDFLIALGTHPPLSDEMIYKLVGVDQDEHRSRYPKARFFNHRWRDPGQLRHVGTISAADVKTISGGLMNQAVKVTVNKLIFDYDLLIIIGPTFPHEVVGFSGGNKYFFPGIAGQEIIDMFHWLGALITNPGIIGRKATPVRRIVDKAAAFIPIERMCLSLVMREHDLVGLYIGSPEEAWSKAADLSAQVNIVYRDHPFRKVLSCAPPMYTDLWTGGKCMYKLEPVVADGGELIIYGPHIWEISVTHGEILRRVGYHVRDYFLKQADRFKDISGGILAHATHVKGIGTYENGIEKPRIKVVLATQIPEELCREINLGYRDPQTIDIKAWQEQSDGDRLYVPRAGETLNRLLDDPF